MKSNRLSPDKHKYLQIITSIADAPKTLHYYGTLPDHRRPSVAIVGSRKPTAYGNEVTYRLAYDLAKQGIVIISGLAIGIDAIAHRAALDAGGTTIAVLASGLDHIYPARHANLTRHITENGGAIITEYEGDVLARDFQFLARNRIVSGLSDGVIVTEAASRSGTLATVRHALDQGREVFAVPGNITSPLSVDCNILIKQGATPIVGAQDVVEVIAPELLEAQTKLALGQNTAETTIITLLNEGIRDGEQLLQLSQLGASEFLQTLTMMELNGLIRSLGGNQWTLR